MLAATPDGVPGRCGFYSRSEARKCGFARLRAPRLSASARLAPRSYRVENKPRGALRGAPRVLSAPPRSPRAPSRPWTSLDDVRAGGVRAGPWTTATGSGSSWSSPLRRLRFVGDEAQPRQRASQVRGGARREVAVQVAAMRAAPSGPSRTLVASLVEDAAAATTSRQRRLLRLDARCPRRLPPRPRRGERDAARELGERRGRLLGRVRERLPQVTGMT